MGVWAAILDVAKKTNVCCLWYLSGLCSLSSSGSCLMVTPKKELGEGAGEGEALTRPGDELLQIRI